MSNSDYGELVWENGQVVIKGGRFSKVSRFTHEDSFINSKTGKYRTNLGFDEAVTGDDDAHMAPWFYPLDDLFNHESTSGFLAEISGVTSNDLQSYTTFSATHKPSNPVKDSDLIALELQKRQDKQVLPRGGRTCDEANFSSFSRGKTDSDTHETAVAREGVLEVTDGQTNDSTREFLPVEKQATAMRGEDVLKLNQVIGGNVLIEFMDAEKIREPAAAAPSVCSDNSGVGASNNPTYHLKRKHNDEEDWEYSNEDAEEESAAGYKRNRSAEVHNLTERKRREKINDKMRALQELIPNCNKVDKATMLDEAIDYLRVLQFQVQIMSMCAPAIMPQPGLQHLHALAHLPLFVPMGFATQGFPAQAACFPGQSNPASTLWNEARPVLPGLSIPGSTVISTAAAEILNFKDLHIV